MFSATSYGLIRCFKSELTHPIFFFKSGMEVFPNVSPRTVNFPLEGQSYPVISLSSVVLPEPFNPQIAQFSWSFICQFICCNIGCLSLINDTFLQLINTHFTPL